MGFLLFNADGLYALIYGAMVLAGFGLLGGTRGFLKGRGDWLLLFALALDWMLLFPLGALFVEQGFKGQAPAWSGWLILASLFLFIALAGLLIISFQGRRLFAISFIAFNIPAWLFTMMIAAMAASGSWL